MNMASTYVTQVSDSIISKVIGSGYPETALSTRQLVLKDEACYLATLADACIENLATRVTLEHVAFCMFTGSTWPHGLTCWMFYKHCVVSGCFDIAKMGVITPAPSPKKNPAVAPASGIKDQAKSYEQVTVCWTMSSCGEACSLPSISVWKRMLAYTIVSSCASDRVPFCCISCSNTAPFEHLWKEGPSSTRSTSLKLVKKQDVLHQSIPAFLSDFTVITFPDTWG